jgi:hypothetical protein
MKLLEDDEKRHHFISHSLSQTKMDKNSLIYKIWGWPKHSPGLKLKML